MDILIEYSFWGRAVSDFEIEETYQVILKALNFLRESYDYHRDVATKVNSRVPELSYSTENIFYRSHYFKLAR